MRRVPRKIVFGKDGTMEEVIDLYRAWLIAQPGKVDEVKRELKGKDLVCFCSPKPCHGDVLIEIANEIPIVATDRFKETHEAVRAHYLSLPGKTEAGWTEVVVSPQKFNRVWNHMLGFPPSDKPPQIDYKTGEIRR